MSPRIEVETISEDGKKALNAMLNKAIQVEYDIILNYPRVIDYFVNFKKVTDERLLSDMETIGRDSTRHLGWVADIIKSLGGEVVWPINTVERDFKFHERRGQQLEKEKMAVELYKEAISLVRGNVVRDKVEDYSGKLVKYDRKGLQKEVRRASEVVGILERIENDEIRHVKMVKDMRATYDFLSGES